MLYKLEELKLRMEIDRLEKILAFYEKYQCSSQGESSKSIKLSSSSFVASRVISSIEIHDEQQNHSEDIIFEACDNNSKECTYDSIPFEKVPLLNQVQFDSLHGDFILIDCVLFQLSRVQVCHFNCQEFRYATFLCPSGKIFTWIEEKDKLIEDPILKFDDGELVDNKNVLTCEDKSVILLEQQ